MSHVTTTITKLFFGGWRPGLCIEVEVIKVRRYCHNQHKLQPCKGLRSTSLSFSHAYYSVGHRKAVVKGDFKIIARNSVLFSAVQRIHFLILFRAPGNFSRSHQYSPSLGWAPLHVVIPYGDPPP